MSETVPELLIMEDSDDELEDIKDTFILVQPLYDLKQENQVEIGDNDPTVCFLGNLDEDPLVSKSDSECTDNNVQIGACDRNLEIHEKNVYTQEESYEKEKESKVRKQYSDSDFENSNDGQDSENSDDNINSDDVIQDSNAISDMSTRDRQENQDTKLLRREGKYVLDDMNEEVENENIVRKDIQYLRVNRDRKFKTRMLTGDRPFGCSLCELSFSTLNLLSEHQYAHKNQNLYLCSRCKTEFKFSLHFLNHKCITTRNPCVRCRKYPGSKGYRYSVQTIRHCVHNSVYYCNICHESRRNESDLKSHKCKGFYCKNCKNCFLTYHKFVSHKHHKFLYNKCVKSDEEDNHNYFICEYCGEVVPQFCSKQHKRNCVSKDKRLVKETCTKTCAKDSNSKKVLNNYVCYICNETFETDSPNEHVLDNDGLKKSCDICKESFGKKDDLINHKKLHSGRITYKCDNCTKIFYYKSSLISHMTEHVNVSTLQENVSKGSNHYTTVVDPNKKYICKICNNEQYQIHSSSSHWKNSGLKFLKKLYFQCSMCNKIFVDSHALNMHKRVHTSDLYVCIICEKQCAKKYQNNHLLIHLYDKQFKCSGCKNIFKTLNLLLEHGKSCQKWNEVNNKRDTETGKSNESSYEQNKIKVKDMKTKVKSISMKKDIVDQNKPQNALADIENPEVLSDIVTSLKGNQRERMIKSKVNQDRAEEITVTEVEGGSSCHTMNKKQKEESVTCKICLKIFSNQSILEIHTRNHNVNKPHLCHKCGKNFMTADGLDLHVRNHSLVGKKSLSESSYTAETTSIDNCITESAETNYTDEERDKNGKLGSVDPVKEVNVKDNLVIKTKATENLHKMKILKKCKDTNETKNARVTSDNDSIDTSSLNPISPQNTANKEAEIVNEKNADKLEDKSTLEDKIKPQLRDAMMAISIRNEETQKTAVQEVRANLKSKVKKRKSKVVKRIDDFAKKANIFINKIAALRDHDYHIPIGFKDFASYHLFVRKTEQRYSKEQYPTNSKKPYACQVCPNHYIRPCLLKEHDDFHVNGKRDFICTICDVNFGYMPPAYCRHMETHYYVPCEEKPRKHIIDDKETDKLIDEPDKDLTGTLENNPANGMSILNEKQTFSCNLCRKSFVREYNVVIHKQRYHGVRNINGSYKSSLKYQKEHSLTSTSRTISKNLKADVRNLDPDTAKANNIYVCPKCGNDFGTSYLLFQRHVCAKRDGTSLRESQSNLREMFENQFKRICEMREGEFESSVKCDVCSEEFKTRALIMEHILEHEVDLAVQEAMGDEDNMNAINNEAINHEDMVVIDDEAREIGITDAIDVAIVDEGIHATNNEAVVDESTDATYNEGIIDESTHSVENEGMDGEILVMEFTEGEGNSIKANPSSRREHFEKQFRIINEMSEADF